MNNEKTSAETITRNHLAFQELTQNLKFEMPCTVPRVWYNRYCYTLFLERCYSSLFLFSLNPSVLRWFTHIRPFPSPTWAWVYLSQKPHKRLGWADHKYREHLNFLQPLSSLFPHWHHFIFRYIHVSRTTRCSAIIMHWWKRWPAWDFTRLLLLLETQWHMGFFSLLMKETMSELHLPMKFLTKILFNYLTD